MAALSRKVLRKRIVIALAAVMLVLIAVLAARWYVATARVKEVAAASALAASKAGTTRQTDPVRSRVSPAGAGEAFHLAAMHQPAIEQYRARSAADMKALPASTKALDTEQVEQLKALADAGNARAACVLAMQISKCAFFPVVGRKEVREREASLARLRAESDDVTAAEARLAGSRAMLQALDASCEGFSVGSEHKAWMYLLQSALMGFEPAMSQFSGFPLFDPEDINASIDGFSAYMYYAGPLTEALAQRGDLNAVTQASWDYSNTGPTFLGMIGLNALPRDPARALMYAYVRQEIMLRREAITRGSTGAWGRPEAAVARYQTSVGDDGQAWARQMADQMIATFDASVFAPPSIKPESDVPKNFPDAIDSFCRE